MDYFINIAAFAAILVAVFILNDALGDREDKIYWAIRIAELAAILAAVIIFDLWLGVSVVFGFFSFVILVSQWHGTMMGEGSPVFMVGGLAGAIALLTYPLYDLSFYCRIPILLDFRSLMSIPDFLRALRE